MARRRSLAVLAIFAAAMLIAFIAPRPGFALVYIALILHVQPEVLGSLPSRIRAMSNVHKTPGER